MNNEKPNHNDVDVEVDDLSGHPESGLQGECDPDELVKEWQKIQSIEKVPAKSRKLIKAISPAERTIGLVKKHVQFFKDQNARIFGLHEYAVRADVYYLDESSFSDLVVRIAYDESRDFLNDNQLKQVCNQLSAMALFEADTRPVYVRSFTDSKGTTYIHVSNDSGDVIKVTNSMWTVINESECPVLFWRTSLQSSLVLPDLIRQHWTRH